MNLRRIGVAFALATMTLGALVASTGLASAHERRNVQAYTFVVGWLTEPAFVNQPNSLDLRITRTADSSPVTDLQTSLKFEVTAAGKTVEVPIAARFNTPGAYNAYVFPTRTGTYTFRIFGTIEGAQIDEKFTSGPGTFSNIDEPNAFPEPLASASNANGASDLEARIVALESDSGSGDSGGAMIVGIIGIIAGVAGLGVGGLALSKSKS